MFLGVSTPHNPKGRDPSVSKIFGTSYMRAHSKRHNNQVLHGEQTVHGRPRMLRRDLFSVANHFNMSWESTLPVQKRNFSHVLNPIETSNTLHDPVICGKFTGFLAGGELAATLIEMPHGFPMGNPWVSMVKTYRLQETHGYPMECTEFCCTHVHILIAQVTDHRFSIGFPWITHGEPWESHEF